MTASPPLPPQSQEAERGLLSSFMLDPMAVGRLCAERRIGTAHFFTEAHGTIYALLLRLWSENQPIDFIIVTQKLRDENALDACGGAAYVTDLFTYLPTAANATQYLDILEEKRVLREIIAICTAHATRSYLDQAEMPGILADVQAKIAALGTGAVRTVPTMRENVIEAIGALEGRLGESPNVVATGLAALDGECGPIERGNLVVIGGQTKAGKSILAGQIALNLAMEGKPVLFVSLEMSERELTLRWLASMARVDTRMVRLWNEFEHSRFAAAQARLAVAPAVIVTRCYQLSEIVAVCQQYAARPEGLACIVLDYAQLTSAARNAKDDRRSLEIAEVSRTAKRLAGTLQCLFVLLTQLNDDGRAKESRDIENDANLMVEVGHDKESGVRGVKVVLARSAPSGQRLKLRIIPEHTRVEDAPDMEFSEPEPTKRRKKYEH